MDNKKEIIDLIYKLKLIADGEPVDTFEEYGFIRVENPDFNPTDGSNPYYIIDIPDLERKLLENE